MNTRLCQYQTRYLTEPIERFGAYSTDELTVPPDAYDAHLDVDFQAIGSAA